LIGRKNNRKALKHGRRRREISTKGIVGNTTSLVIQPLGQRHPRKRSPVEGEEPTTLDPPVIGTIIGRRTQAAHNASGRRTTGKIRNNDPRGKDVEVAQDRKVRRTVNEAEATPDRPMGMVNWRNNRRRRTANSPTQGRNIRLSKKKSLD
jgi:hypothetical protein